MKNKNDFKVMIPCKQCGRKLRRYKRPAAYLKRCKCGARHGRGTFQWFVAYWCFSLVPVPVPVPLPCLVDSIDNVDPVMESDSCLFYFSTGGVSTGGLSAV
jgi:hypothetical protein